VVLHTLMGMGSLLVADLLGSVTEALSAVCVSVSLWFSWWILQFWLVFFILQNNGYFDLLCQQGVDSFYCDTGRTIGAFAILFVVLLTAMVAVSVMNARGVLAKRSSGTSNNVLVGLIVLGFIGQLFWMCANLKLINHLDAFSSIDLTVLLLSVFINLLFTIHVSFAARVIHGTQAMAHLSSLVSGATAIFNWSLVINDGRRLNEGLFFLSVTGGGSPPCNGGTYCAESAVTFVGLLFMTLSQTFSAIYCFMIIKRLPQGDTNSRHDMLLQHSDETGSYQPVAHNTHHSGSRSNG